MSGFLDMAADFATAVGLPMVLLAGWAAVRSYRSARRAAADAHMHALFREYLLARLEITRGGAPAPLGAPREASPHAGVSDAPAGGAAARPAALPVAVEIGEAGGELEAEVEVEAAGEKGIGGQLAALKLYALEAMWDWIRRQDSRWQRNTPLRGFQSWRTHWDVLDSWKETIIVHLEQERDEALRSIESYTQCYSLSFLEFVRESGVLDPERVQAAIDGRDAKKRSGLLASEQA